MLASNSVTTGRAGLTVSVGDTGSSSVAMSVSLTKAPQILRSGGRYRFASADSSPRTPGLPTLRDESMVHRSGSNVPFMAEASIFLLSLPWWMLRVSRMNLNGVRPSPVRSSRLSMRWKRPSCSNSARTPIRSSMVSYKGNRSGFNDPSDMPPATARASSVTLNAVVLPEALMPATPMAVLMLMLRAAPSSMCVYPGSLTASMAYRSILHSWFSYRRRPLMA